MRRVVLGTVAFAILFSLQAWLRPKTREPEGQQVESSLTVLAGALRPLFVAMTWVEAEAAIDDHRFLDALDRLRLLEAADPAGWEAALFRAHVIAHNLADRETSPEGRAARIAEAFSILDSAAARTSDPGPEVAKGQLLLEARMWDPGLSARLETKLGRSPRAAALAAFEEAVRRAPDSEKIRRLAMEATRLRAIELLMTGDPPEEALVLFDRAGAIAMDVAEDVLARKLARSWATIVRAALTADADAIGRAEAGFLSALSEWGRAAAPVDDSEAVLASVLARRAVAIAEKRLRGGDPRAALSLLRVVHTIRNFVFARLDRSHLALNRDIADRRRVLSLLDEIDRQAPDLSSRISELRMLVSAW